MFVCICGFREKLSDFEKRREERGAGKADVSRYLRNQQELGGSTALADALKKWQEENK